MNKEAHEGMKARHDTIACSVNIHLIGGKWNNRNHCTSVCDLILSQLKFQHNIYIVA